MSFSPRLTIGKELTNATAEVVFIPIHSEPSLLRVLVPIFAVFFGKTTVICKLWDKYKFSRGVTYFFLLFVACSRFQKRNT